MKVLDNIFYVTYLWITFFGKKVGEDDKAKMWTSFIQDRKKGRNEKGYAYYNILEAWPPCTRSDICNHLL